MLHQFWILGKMEEEGFTIEMEGKWPNAGRSFKQKNTHRDHYICNSGLIRNPGRQNLLWLKI